MFETEFCFLDAYGLIELTFLDAIVLVKMKLK